jgi:hypothetical protein
VATSDATPAAISRASRAGGIEEMEDTYTCLSPVQRPG